MFIEYGGNAGPIAELKKHWYQIFMKNRFVLFKNCKLPDVARGSR
jgi:hypothetical protein